MFEFLSEAAFGYERLTGEIEEITKFSADVNSRVPITHKPLDMFRQVFSAIESSRVWRSVQK